MEEKIRLGKWLNKCIWDKVAVATIEGEDDRKKLVFGDLFMWEEDGHRYYIEKWDKWKSI